MKIKNNLLELSSCAFLLTLGLAINQSKKNIKDSQNELKKYQISNVEINNISNKIESQSTIIFDKAYLWNKTVDSVKSSKNITDSAFYSRFRGEYLINIPQNIKKIHIKK